MQYKFIVLLNTTIASFMAILDSNIVLISLPSIIRNLPGTPDADAIWIIMGYILMLSTIMLTFGRLADLHGRVRLYTLGFAVFTIASALCSASPNGFTLIVFRLVQGVGGALIFANGTAIITDAFPASERGRALGINQIGGTAGSVAGLVLGGVLTASLGWRSIFWINIPIGGFATIWAYTQLKEMSTPLKGERPDPVGMVLFGVGLASILVGLTFGSVGGWMTVDVALMIAGAVLLVAFVFAERRIRSPMMDLRLFRIRLFSFGILSNLLAAIARGAASIVLVFYFQGALLLDALTAGILLIPFSLAFVVAGPTSGYLSDKFGPRRFATGGLILSGIAFLTFALLPVNTPYDFFVIPMILAGAGGGMFIAPNIASIMNSVPMTRRGIASGISSTLLNAGFLLSIGISFVIMAQSMPLSVLQAIFAGISVQAGAVNLVLFHQATERIFLFMATISFIAAIPSWARGPVSRPGREAETPGPATH